MRKCRLVGVLLAATLAGCGEFETAKVSETTLRVTCPPWRMEVGLHVRTPLPDVIDNTPIRKLPMKTIVRVYDEADGEKVYDHEAAMPAVYWMADKQADRVRSLGLQEVEMPLALTCKTYRVEVEIGEYPPWLAQRAKAADLELYARKAKH